MAAARHNLTRRALLGAGAGACLGDMYLLRVPAWAAGSPAGAGDEAHRGHVRGHVPSRARWARALAAYRRAEAHLSAFQVGFARLPPAARAFPACQPFEDRYDELECARLAALRRLLRLPAPGLPALALKLELTIDDQAWEFTGAETCLAALKADARMLLGEA